MTSKPGPVGKEIVTRILIVENEPRDILIAEQCAMRSGFSGATATQSADEALALLTKARADAQDLPDAILLDLDLGSESGFDLLRSRYRTPWLMTIPLIVWTGLSDHNHDICGVFKIQGYVSKSADEQDLCDVLESVLLQPSRDN